MGESVTVTASVLRAAVRVIHSEVSAGVNDAVENLTALTLALESVARRDPKEGVAASVHV